MRKSKTLLYISILIIIISSFVGCSTKSDISTSDEPTKATACTNHLYWKDINVKVLDVIYGFNYTVITVYSEEYDIKKQMTVSGNHMFDLSVGDYITAELYTYKNDETGEINSRSIHSITSYKPLGK